VVVSALVQNNEDLAISNILGSCTANILGSFSIGLLFSRRDAPLTLSANDAFSGRLYSSILVLIEVGVMILGPGWTLLRHRGHAGGAEEGKSAGRWVGIVLLVGFAMYVAGIWYGIKKGKMTERAIPKARARGGVVVVLGGSPGRDYNELRLRRHPLRWLLHRLVGGTENTVSMVSHAR
jgi:hypothetical protein